MLGIGFIITHLVAMQKPQQRKYHSSCNRSVHRGTAHGKQEVKVCKRKTPHLFLMRSFLSPCGDGTYYVPQFANLGEFSPPYGDGTEPMSVKVTGVVFSSPYGDGTEPMSVKVTGVVFSSPYGDKSKSALQGLDRQQMTFPSPCGDKLKSMLLTPTTWASSFRPLAGRS